MKFGLDSTPRRIALAIGISLLLHGLMLWGPEIRLPSFRPALPTLTAKLEALPAEAVKPKPRHKPSPSAQPPVSAAPSASPQPDVAQAASAAVAASAPAATETIASATDHAAKRPPLPQHAQLTFAVNKGTSNFRVGEAIHTLEIKAGRYVLKSTTTTVGLARLFKSYELDQYSNGSYDKDGLHPELFTEERIEKVATQRNAVELDRTAQQARFSNGIEMELPPDTQDILSVLYQFPPLAHAETTTVSVCNGKKIEQYQFAVFVNETIDTPLGKLLTVHLRKIHGPDEEGLEIWLAREYRLFPVKMRFLERNGDITGEAVITDIRVSEEQGARSDAVN